MLDYNPLRMPLVRENVGLGLVFTRGQYEYWTVDKVTEKDPGYISWLVSKATIDTESHNLLVDFMEKHPDLFGEG